MTDPHPPLSDDDLSAALDGAADPDVQDRLQQDPAAQARQRELAGATALVRTPVAPLPADQVDELVATALAAPVAPARARRPRAGSPWLVAAVVVILVAVGLTLIWNGRSQEDDQLATSQDAAATTTAPTLAEDGVAAGALDEAAPEAAESQAGTATSVPEFPPTDLGEFADGDALRTALAAQWPVDAPRTSAGDPPPIEAFDRCADQLAITLELGEEPLTQGYAIVDDALTLVYEWERASFEDGQPTTLVTAVGRDACDQVAIFER